MRTARDLKCYLVERDKVMHEKLTGLLGQHPHVWIAPQGSIEENIDLVMSKVADDPLFAFLDPYGFPPSLQLIRRILARSDHLGGRDRGPATELLLNFSVPAVTRHASLVTSTKPNRAEAKQLMRLNEALDGTWWQSIWMTEDEETRFEVVLKTYMRDLENTGPGWQVFAVPVYPSIGRKPIYYLIFCTRSPHGVASFANACSLALEDYCAFLEKGGMRLDFGEGGFKEFGKQKWVPIIKKNIQKLLDYGDVRALEWLREIYGETFGLARDLHINRAVRELVREGKAQSDGGRIEHLVIRSARRPILPPERRRKASGPTLSRLELGLRPWEFDHPTA
jgi:three-Cys-motif partner protein